MQIVSEGVYGRPAGEGTILVTPLGGALFGQRMPGHTVGVLNGWGGNIVGRVPEN